MYALLNKLFNWLSTHAAVFCIGLGMGLYRCAHEWPVWFGVTCMYALLNKLFNWLSTHAAVFCIGLGMGLYRCAHEWPVWFGEELAHQETLPLGAENLFLLVDTGKVLGILGYVAACYLWDRKRKSGILLTLPSMLLLIGYLGPLLWSIGVGVSPLMLLVFLMLCGAAAGMVFAQWIEICGHLGPLKMIEALAVSYLVRTLILPVVTSCDSTASALLIMVLGGTEICGHLGPLKMIEALAVSYLVRTLILPVVTSCDSTASALLIMVLGGTTFIQIALAYRVVSAPSPTEAAVYPRVLPPLQRRTGHSLLFAWVCIFTFAFGLGEASTKLAHEVMVSGIGYAIPSLLVAMLAFSLADRFDRNALYAVSIPLMGAGLVSLEFFGASAALSQVLVSAGMCAFELLAYTIACTTGFRTHTSSMLIGSAVRVLALVSADCAVLLVRLAPHIDTQVLVALATLATVVMGFAMFLPRMGGRLDREGIPHNRAPASENTREGRIELAAEHAGLSPRERTVFDLLVQDKTTSQISEELFISNGAVRAHCSRIYAKFGVHNRKAFDEVLARL